MLNRYKYRNWTKNYPTNFLEYMLSPCGSGLRIINFIFQKILRLNKKTKFMIHFTSIVNGNIEIGKGVAQSFANSGGCYIQGINGIKIGDNTIFAPGIKIISANHDKEDITKHVQTDPVVIGANCWLGANCIILPGVQLGDGVIVGAGSIVTKSFPCGSIIAGNPAKIIRNSSDKNE